MKEPITVYKATTRHGQICHFGEHSTATAWARGGTVEQVELPAPNELSVVGGKELRKYYFHTTSPAVGQPGHSGYYLASEADAAFAEMRREHAEYVAHTNTECSKAITALRIAHAEEIERLKAEHEKTLRRQASAALSGMDAAKKISSYQLERAAKLHSESKPEAIDSERRANAILTEENERLRKQAERYEKLRRLTAQEFRKLRQISGGICQPSFDSLVDQLPASGQS